MAIVQISKIQQRSGNIVDLPQLDNAELGWASDARRLFIGNDNNITGVENVEVLTSYSTIDFDQINGAEGNLDIDGANLANGQIMTYDGNNWTNRGGNIGGLITLGDVSNVRIDGGAIGYVLETDGTGNLSWTAKSTIVSFIKDVTNANPAVVTTTEDNFFINGQQVTFTNLPGVSGSAGNSLNGLSYYANVLTSNTFSLYTDITLTTTLNLSGDTAFPYTSATQTGSTLDQVTVGDATPFTINDAVIFVGNVDTANSTLVEGQTYYVKTKDTATPNTWITLSDTVGGNTVALGNATFTANVYSSGGRAISPVGGSGVAVAAGANTAIQYNNNNILDGDADFTWNFASPKVLTINGNANIGNLNATSSVIASTLTSNIATGTPPITVSSTTRVSNLNVSYSNVSDFEVVTAQTTGTFYPVFVNGSATANRALGANANLSFNAATGNLSTTLLNVTGNANVGNLGSSGLIVATGNVTGGNLVTAGAADVTGNLTAGNIHTAGTVTASRLISNVATGTAPLTVTSTTRVSNLNVSYSNVSDFEVVTAQTTGTFYPVFVNGSSTANRALGANANLSFDAATGALSASLITGTLTTAAQPNIASYGNGTTVTVAGNLNPNANVTYDLGNSTNRWNDIYLAGSTIYLGNATITSNASGVVVTNASGGSFTIGGTSAANGAAIVNGTSNVIVVNNGNVSISSAGNANILTVTGTGANISGTLGVTGNANVGNVGAAAGVFTGTLNVTGNANVGNVGAAAGVFTGTINVTGNANVGNLGTAGLIVATGNITGGNLNTGGIISVTGNANVSGNINVTNNIITGGNITGANVISATSLTGNLTTAAQPNVTSLGNLTSLVVTGTANLNTTLTTLITTGSNSTAGQLTGNWTLTAGSRLQATYADLAEYYSSDIQYEPGTVLEFGGEKEVTLASDGSIKVAGVVSTDPAYVMNSNCQGEFIVPIALQGRVPVKVRGKIRKGDLMMSGGNGYARPSLNPQMGSIIGKSLENFDGLEGIIEIAVGRL